MCKKQNFTNEQRNSFNNDLRLLQSKFSKFSDLPKNKHIRHDTGIFAEFFAVFLQTVKFWKLTGSGVHKSTGMSQHKESQKITLPAKYQNVYLLQANTVRVE